MKKQYKTKFPIPYYIIYLFIPYTLSHLFGIVMETDMSNRNQLIYTLLISIGVKLFSLFPLLLFLILALFALGVVASNYYFPHTVRHLIGWLWKFFWNVVQHIQGKEDILKENAIVLWAILTILLCIYTYIAILKVRRPLLLIPLYCTFFIYYWYIYIDQSYKMMAIFIFALVVLFSLQKYNDAKSNFKYKPWLKTAICYGFIAILAGQILPKGNNVLNWPWLEEKTYNYFPVLASMRTDGGYEGYGGAGGPSGIFSLAETGFNPEGSRLGGPVKQSNRVVMTVKAPYPVYLRGRVSENYEKNQWATGKWNNNRLWLNKNLPMEIDEDQVVEISVIYSGFSSNTLFTPNMPISITNIDGKTVFADENNQITVPSTINQNQGYRLISILPGTKWSFEMERDIDKNYYLQLPFSISDGVYHLSRAITEGKAGQYEKALSIESYLRQNYRYSLDVPFVPKNKEFVDYFLFEEKEGYCTYFATAMAVLLRAEGIPSRYVEGYQLPKESKDGIYTITQKQAHAWVEAYIEGQGWITFDPTPSSNTSDLDNNTSVDNSQANEEDVFSDEMDQEDAVNTMNPNNMNIGLNEEELQNEIDTIENQGKKLSELLNISKGHMVFIVFLALFLWILLKASIAYYSRRRFFKMIEKLSNKDSSIYLYNNILRMLKGIGYARNNGETPYEYAQRISPKIYGHEFDFKEVTELYLKAKYSNMEISKEEKDVFISYLNYIENKLKVKLGKPKYIYNKYIIRNFYL